MRSLPEPAMNKCSGIVFDIKRFATHDGEGIRTTVFLKGCPLRCAWCQNPEGLRIQPQILYMENKCMHCGSCVQLSKHRGVTIKDGVLQIDRHAEEDWAMLCEECPTGALRFDAITYTVEEIMDCIHRDDAFFTHGGGVTLSGGEPLLQHEFALEILKRCHADGIHTAIETSAYVEPEIFTAVMPYIDHFFIDMKLFDKQVHKNYTGVENDKIKENIRHILTSDRRDDVTIRTPLIPNMSACMENIAAISAFISGLYPDVRYELLNYNPLAKAKYDYLNMKYCFEDNPKLYTKDEMKVFYQCARTHGIRQLIIE